jgi:hypothetical protein
MASQSKSSQLLFRSVSDPKRRRNTQISTEYACPKVSSRTALRPPNQQTPRTKLWHTIVGVEGVHTDVFMAQNNSYFYPIFGMHIQGKGRI